MFLEMESFWSYFFETINFGKRILETIFLPDVFVPKYLSQNFLDLEFSAPKYRKTKDFLTKSLFELANSLPLNFP